MAEKCTKFRIWRRGHSPNKSLLMKHILILIKYYMKKVFTRSIKNFSKNKFTIFSSMGASSCGYTYKIIKIFSTTLKSKIYLTVVSNYKVLLLVKVKNLIKTRVRRLLFFNLKKKRIKKKIFNIEKNWQQFSPRRGVWGLNW